MRLGALLLAATIAFFSATISASERIELPPGPNRDLVYARCRVCHDLQYVVESAGITQDNWVALIQDMRELEDDTRSFCLIVTDGI